MLDGTVFRSTPIFLLTEFVNRNISPMMVEEDGHKRTVTVTDKGSAHPSSSI